MADVDMARARALMAAAGLDGMVVVKPENVQYVSGVHPGPASWLWRRAGPAMVLLPADDALAPAAVIPDTQEVAFRQGSDIRDLRTHPLWIEIDDVSGLLADDRPIEDVIRVAAQRRPKPADRPGTYDLDRCLRLLSDAVRERGLEHSRLGIELDFIAANDLRAVRDRLPHARFVDSTRVFAELRAIKNAREIAALRLGAELTEAGLRYAVAHLASGMPAAGVALAYRAGVIEAARERGVASLEATWDIISVGPQPWGRGMTTAQVEDGALLKFDVGCTVAGLEADVGRTFVFGRAREYQRRIQDGLLQAHDAARAAMRPGVPISEVFHAALAAMRAAGFPTYTRGHFGHSLGSDFGHEEWPYIEAAEHCVLAQGMVFALETPYYIDGIGGYITEDQILLTPQGHENMNTLPRDLVEVR
ncbi:MAG: M24 family metallopeptidase [Chloroflexi bacterium]|nr:M24 family metallopeptidase [Chloroflexota bacterium]